MKLSYQAALLQFEQKGGDAPEQPKAHLSVCPSCLGSGLKAADHPPVADTEHYPHVAIIGGGIGGVILGIG